MRQRYFLSFVVVVQTALGILGVFLFWFFLEKGLLLLMMPIIAPSKK